MIVNFSFMGVVSVQPTMMLFTSLILPCGDGLVPIFYQVINLPLDELIPRSFTREKSGYSGEAMV
jgi:hypothetical protein